MRKIFVISTALALTACVSQVTESLEATPEWFESRRQEMLGKGYPELSVIHRASERVEPVSWEQIEADLSQKVAELRAQPGVDPALTPDAIRNWAAQKRKRVELDDGAAGAAAL